MGDEKKRQRGEQEEDEEDDDVVYVSTLLFLALSLSPLSSPFLFTTLSFHCLLSHSTLLSFLPSGTKTRLDFFARNPQFVNPQKTFLLFWAPPYHSSFPSISLSQLPTYPRTHSEPTKSHLSFSFFFFLVVGY